MMVAAFLQGLVLAAGLILPLGPQNVFVLNQGIFHRRWWSAVPVAVTASLCDTMLILTAVLGVSLTVFRAPWLKTGLTVAGIIFLAYMGYVTWRSAPSGATGVREAWPARRQIAFALSVSLLNPHAIMDTVGVIGPAALAYPAGAPRLVFAGACIINSWLWFFLLITVGHTLRATGRIERLRVWLSRASAVIMWSTALLLLRVFS